MMWYGISKFPGYRINHLGEVMSLKQEEPRIMKTWESGHHRYVVLRQNDRSVSCKISDLLVLADLHMPEKPVEKSHHYEAARSCCDKGHKFTPENTMKRKCRGRIVRKCKRCHRDSVTRWRAKKAREVQALPATG